MDRGGPMRHRALQNCNNEPNGAPNVTQRSGHVWERTSSGMSESWRIRRDEGYEACEDDVGADVLIRPAISHLPPHPALRATFPPVGGRLD